MIIFARAPELGGVKTRLASELGDARALEIYRELAEGVLVAARRVPRCRTLVAFTPAGRGDTMRAWLGDTITYIPQSEGDLGTRMRGATERAIADGAARVVIVGTDCPELDERVIESAFDALKRHDVVFGPATDGGYYLIGMRRAHPELFGDIPWSEGTTLTRSLAAARAAGLAIHLLDILTDVDTAADWARWTARPGVASGRRR